MRDKSSELAAADCIVLGASFDTVPENKAFADHESFHFRLLSDVDRKVGELYQVTRSPDDERANYPLRLAYLIDPEGTIRKAYDVTDTAGFASAVVSDLDQLRRRS